MRSQTFTPASIPVVDTLKSRYANESGSHGLYSRAQRLFGKSSNKYTRTFDEHLTGTTLNKDVISLTDSPVSRTGGHDLKSTATDASLDFRSLEIAWVVITHTERLTCTHQHVYSLKTVMF